MTAAQVRHQIQAPLLSPACVKLSYPIPTGDLTVNYLTESAEKYQPKLPGLEEARQTPRQEMGSCTGLVFHAKPCRGMEFKEAQQEGKALAETH